MEVKQSHPKFTLIDPWLSGVVPITKETSGDQDELSKYPVREDLCYRWAADATKGAEGLPIGVQVVGRRFQEELVLHVMKEIETLAKMKE